ncbi:LIM domain only protein 7-like isoform X3 [Nerophis ophidion]|uniref:LIM domain only protein 7-like isoform X3 n=1 Tax=Nerophis ophidion TaxID=159077 RepID=UPI002ADF868E|nr:LIM domain only protein 7-like isoform X3 [Nerophis ophidion]
MEWREQSTATCQDAYVEAQRWIEAVTKKTFKGKDFRSSLENGVLLCDLINKIKPGVVKKVNRLPTPIAWLDNINVFLKACLKLGLKEAQLFHPGDLQDLSSRVTVKDEETNRRLRNVVITVYWLSRRAQSERSYNGPYLNFKAFEGLLGIALHKALQDGQKDVRDSSFSDNWYSEQPLGGGGRGGHRRDDSLDSLDSLGSQPHSLSSDATLKGSSEGCCSDAEADAAFKMADNKESLQYRRSLVVTPKVSTQFNQFLPSKNKTSGYVPAPLRKKQADRNNDNRRSLVNPVYEDEAPLARSKSTSDIQQESSAARQLRYEELAKYREQVKQTEDKWQDDLSKWKNRRSSLNFDIKRKKEEREKIEQDTYGNDRRSKTFKEMQDARENRRNSSIGSRISSLSFDDDGDVFNKPTPPSREVLSRSHTIDTPFESSDTAAPSQKEDNPPAAYQTRFRSSKQESDTVDSPAGTTTSTTSTSSTSSRSTSNRTSFYRPNLAGAVSSQKSSVFENSNTAKTEKTSSFVPAPRVPQKVSEPKSPVKVQPPSFGATYKPSQPSTMDVNRPITPTISRLSASLPRSYQKPDSARLTSVVAPRPFGTQSSHVGSLTRSFASKDSSNRINGDVAVTKTSSVPSRYREFITPEDEAESQSSPANSSDDEEDQKESTGKTVTKTSSLLSDPVPFKREVPAKDASQDDYCEMRISLNQKPNSSLDFGFNTRWDSTGAHVASVQPGSPAEMFQLKPGDEVLTVNGHRVADMSYLDWKAGMEEALQEGSLVMDVRRYGQNTAWDRDLPSPPFQSHKTINLTTTDHPVLVGFPAASGTSKLDFTTRPDTSVSNKTTTHSVVDMAFNGVSGGYPGVSLTTMTNDSELLSSKNLKLRSEFFEQGGGDLAMPDIPVPSITPSSRSWSWDPEEERRRQEKWQKEQDRLLQEKYKRDQEKLQGEWLKAQQEISTSVAQQAPNSPHSLISYSSWEEEEERKRKEQMMEPQRLEEERQRREEERMSREEEFERQRKEERKRMEEDLEQRREEERLRREEEFGRQRKEEERKRMEEDLERQRREEEFERQRKDEERRKMEEDLERQRREEERMKRREEEFERQRREEERKRREEDLERQRREEEFERQRRDEERKRREEDLERQRRETEAEEARKRKEKAEEERRQREEELLWQRRKELEQEELGKRQAATQEQQRQERVKSSDQEERFQRKGMLAKPGGMIQWLLDEQARNSRDRLARSQRAVAELEMERRNLLNVMRYREPERVTGSGLFDARGLQPASQAELQRQQLLDDMRKKAPVVTDNSWIRQRSGQDDVPSNRRVGSLDNLDNPHNSWRSSWTPRSDSHIPNYSRPHSALSTSAPFHGGGAPRARSGSSTLPTSLWGPSTGAAPWSQHSPSFSPSSLSPTTSPEPGSDTGGPRQRSRSVSGKKVCTFCDAALGKGAAMIIESLGLCYHLTCFKCFDCHSELGGSEAGAEVRIRNKQLYCNSCYTRVKGGQPTAM